MKQSTLLGGVLVGGRSSRMGTCKAMLQLPNGNTLLHNAIACVEPYCETIVISAAEPDQISITTHATVSDAAMHRGPISGIVALLTESKRIGVDAVLVLSVDLPGLTPLDLQPLVAAWRDEPRRIATASFDGDFSHPLVAIYPTSYLDQLSALWTSEDRSIVRWLDRIPHQSIGLRREAGQDVDTPEQWQAFCASGGP